MYSRTEKIYYTPRKLRLVVDMVRGKKAEESLEYLKNVKKKGALYVHKGIKSALSNAFNKGANVSELVVDEIMVNQSILYKRYFNISRGRVNKKMKRYSTLIVKLK
jgi:large subunit ribosomal protein L22